MEIEKDQMTSSINIIADGRVRWLRQRVLLTLSIPEETFDDYFTRKTHEGKEAVKNIESFLGKDYGPGSTIFFSNKHWTEDIDGTSHII